MTLTAWAFLTIVLGLALYVVAVAVLDPRPKVKPRHRAGDPPPGDDTDALTGRVLDAIRDMQTWGAAKLRREMETSDD